MRKGALNEKIKELGCNKVAYGHHKADMVETLMMSMIFESRIHCFSPVTYLDRMDLTVIRPLMYMNEEDIIGFQNKMELPVAKSPCPMDGNTKREYAKQLIRKLDQDHPGARDHMFQAIVNADLKGWPPKKSPKKTREKEGEVNMKLVIQRVSEASVSVQEKCNWKDSKRISCSDRCRERGYRRNCR